MAVTAEQRRDQVLEAAIHEFAEFGYHAAKTVSIARRAGISQPYIYALFEDKRTLFLACLQRAGEQIKDAFGTAFERDGSLAGYRSALANPDAPRCRLQGHAAAADPRIREFMRSGFIDLSDHLMRLTGADRATVARFMAAGYLLDLGAVLGVPEEYVS